MLAHEAWTGNREVLCLSIGRHIDIFVGKSILEIPFYTEKIKTCKKKGILSVVKLYICILLSHSLYFLIDYINKKRKKKKNYVHTISFTVQ